MGVKSTHKFTAWSLGQICQHQAGRTVRVPVYGLQDADVKKKFGSELEKHLLDGVKPQMSLPVCDKSLC